MGRQKLTKTEFFEIEDSQLENNLGTLEGDDKEEENFEKIIWIDDIIEIENDDQSWLTGRVEE